VHANVDQVEKRARDHSDAVAERSSLGLVLIRGLPIYLHYIYEIIRFNRQSGQISLGENSKLARSRKIPLARGLIGGKTDPIQGQLEVHLADYKRVDIILKRKAYSGRRDIKFSIPSIDLQDMMDILYEAKMKIEERWLSTVASTEISVRKTHSQ
jgi:hypothetical protein